MRQPFTGENESSAPSRRRLKHSLVARAWRATETYHAEQIRQTGAVFASVTPADVLLASRVIPIWKDCR